MIPNWYRNQYCIIRMISYIFTKIVFSNGGMGIDVLCVYFIHRFYHMKTIHKSNWPGYRKEVYQEYPRAAWLEAVLWMAILSMWWGRERTSLAWTWHAITTCATAMQNVNITGLKNFMTGSFWHSNIVGRQIFIRSTIAPQKRLK